MTHHHLIGYFLRTLGTTHFLNGERKKIVSCGTVSITHTIWCWRIKYTFSLDFSLHTHQSKTMHRCRIFSTWDYVLIFIGFIPSLWILSWNNFLMGYAITTDAVVPVHLRDWWRVWGTVTDRTQHHHIWCHHFRYMYNLAVAHLNIWQVRYFCFARSADTRLLLFFCLNIL